MPADIGVFSSPGEEGMTDTWGFTYLVMPTDMGGIDPNLPLENLVVISPYT